MGAVSSGGGAARGVDEVDADDAVAVSECVGCDGGDGCGVGFEVGEMVVDVETLNGVVLDGGDRDGFGVGVWFVDAAGVGVGVFAGGTVVATAASFASACAFDVHGDGAFAASAFAVVAGAVELAECVELCGDVLAGEGESVGKVFDEA